MSHIPKMLLAPLTGLAVLMSVLATTACQSSSPPPLSLAVVLGAHANAKIPVYGGRVEAAARAVADAGGTLVLVLADGTPSVLFNQALPAAVDAGEARKEHIDQAVAPFEEAFNRAVAATPEVDLLGAIALAQQALNGAPGDHQMVVVDSGLSTSGPLQFQQGLLNADPVALVSALQARPGAMPNLGGTSVILSGFGTSTDSPQGPLGSSQRTVLVDLWTRILKSANATSISAVLPSGKWRAAAGLPYVTPVPIQPETPVLPVDPAGPSTAPSSTTGLGSGGTLVYQNATLGFLGDSDQFADPADAEKVLSALAVDAKANHWRLLVTGTTATCSQPAYCQRLSESRAKRVVDILTKLGVADAQAVGAGDSFPGKVPDLRPDGSLDPVKSALNRTVRITLRS